MQRSRGTLYLGKAMISGEWIKRPSPPVLPALGWDVVAWIATLRYLPRKRAFILCFSGANFGWGPLIFRSPLGLKRHWAGSGLPAQCFWVTGLLLHYLRHEATHGFRRLILHLPGGVSVSAEGESCIVVPQHTGDRFDTRTVLQGKGGGESAIYRDVEGEFEPAVRLSTAVVFSLETLVQAM